MSWRMVKEIIWALIFGVMLLFMFPGWGAEIVLKPRVVVTSDMVRLSSIVQKGAEGMDDIILMPAPDMGDALLLKADDVKQLLARRGISVDVVGEVYIYKDVEKISSDELRAWLMPRLKSNGFVLRQSSLPDVFVPRNSDMKLALPYACSDECYAYVKISGEGFHRTVPIRIGYDMAYRVWVLKRNLLPGESIKKRDVVLVEKKGVKNIRNAFSYSKSPVGYVARHPLKEDAVLLKDDVRITYVIRKGQRVKVRYENKGIALEIPGIARENGRPGDVIKVENPDTKKIFFAKVVGEERVEVCL